MPAVSNDDLRATPLYELHLALGAKMVPFAGYSMPLQYPGGIVREHLHTRRAAGLFDVSHMGQLRLTGAGATGALEGLLPLDLAGLAPHRQVYGVLTSDSGGALDDLIACRWGEDEFFLVVNAARVAEDTAYLRGRLPGLQVQALDERALLALQGPEAVKVLAGLLPGAAELPFMGAMTGRIGAADCHVTRSGYTGEDGFEISLAGAAAPELARRLLAHPAVAPVGLGARDTLRLEAGLCLYGHDLDEHTSPVEAGLGWSIGRARRAGGARAGGFPGADRILGELAAGPARRRVGLAIEGRAPVREGAELLTPEGAPVGRVCSGGFSPTLQTPIAMAYVRGDCAAPGTQLTALVRGVPRPLAVCTLPFVPHRYHRA